MKSGHFEVEEPEGYYAGEMLGYPTPLIYKRIPNAGSEAVEEGKPRKPDYRIISFINGEEIVVGAAWEETGKDGMSYYETTLDRLGPLFPDKVYVRLVPSKDKVGEATLYFDTPAEKAAYNAKKAQQTAQPVRAAAEFSMR